MCVQLVAVLLHVVIVMLVEVVLLVEVLLESVVSDISAFVSTAIFAHRDLKHSCSSRHMTAALKEWVDDNVPHVKMDPLATTEDLQVGFKKFGEHLVGAQEDLRSNVLLLNMFMCWEAGLLIKEFGGYLTIQGFFRRTNDAPPLNTYMTMILEAITKAMDEIIVPWDDPQDLEPHPDPVARTSASGAGASGSSAGASGSSAGTSTSSTGASGSTTGTLAWSTRVSRLSPTASQDSHQEPDGPAAKYRRRG